jgi:hypothetical protein
VNLSYLSYINTGFSKRKLFSFNFFIDILIGSILVSFFHLALSIDNKKNLFYYRKKSIERHAHIYTDIKSKKPSNAHPNSNQYTMQIDSSNENLSGGMFEGGFFIIIIK